MATDPSIAALEERLRQRVRSTLDGADVVKLCALPGGASSLTYLATVDGPDGRRLVVKQAPGGVMPVGNRDVLRQSRIMGALRRFADIKVPRILIEDPGSPPDNPPYFAMEFLPGEAFEPHKDTLAAGAILPSPKHLAARAIAATRMLIALHSLSPAELGIGNEPEIALSDEVGRWARLFATVDDDMKPGSLAVETLLLAALPGASPASLIHGDFRLGNLLCQHEDIVAIIDWEIWSRADPRVDLAWFLLTADPNVHPLAIRDAPGMPRPDVLLRVYENARGSVVTGLNWFRALALFKMAASVALIVKHHRRRGGSSGRAAALAPRVSTMLQRACFELEQG